MCRSHLELEEDQLHVEVEGEWGNNAAVVAASHRSECKLLWAGCCCSREGYHRMGQAWL